jgi:hypothetical protein
VLPDQSARAIINGQNVKSYPEEFSGGIGKDGVKNLQTFVEAGGTLICFDNAARFAIQEFKLPLKNALNGVKTSDFYCPGSILKVELDQNHPITKGYGATVDAYFSSSSAFEITDPLQAQAVGKYAETNVLRSGWLLGEKYLAGKAAIVDAQLGSGHVILFGFRPQHRAQAVGTYGLIFNSINLN